MGSNELIALATLLVTAIGVIVGIIQFKKKKENDEELIRQKKEINKKIEELKSNVINPEYLLPQIRDKPKIALYLFSPAIVIIFIIATIFNKTDEFNSSFFLSIFLYFCIAMIINSLIFFLWDLTLKRKLSKIEKKIKKKDKNNEE